MRRSLYRFAVAAILVTSSAAVIALISSRVGNEQLHREVERQLTRLLNGSVHIEAVELLVDGGLQLHGTDIDVYPSDAGPMLTVREARAELHLPSLLVGRFKLARLEFDGVTLRVERSRERAWAPLPFALLMSRPDTSPSRWERHLGIVRGMESVTRFLLERPVIAQQIALRDGSVRFYDDGLGSGRESALTRIDGIEGRLDHHWLGTGAELELRGRLLDPDSNGEAQSIPLEAHGIQGEQGRLQLSLAATGLPLEAIDPYSRELHPEAFLRGSLTGVLGFTTPERGHGSVEADWSLAALDAGLPIGNTPLRVETERSKLYLRLEMQPNRLELATGEFTGAQLDFAVSGTAERPMLESARLQLAAEVEGADFPQLRRVVEALPEDNARPILQMLDRVESGRIVRVDGRGTTRFSNWRRIFDGELQRLPTGFGFGAELAELVVAIGGEDRLTDVGGSIEWSGDRVTVRDARAFWNGELLPSLDLSVEGVSHLVAASGPARVLPRLAAPLPGLPTLIDILDGPDDPNDPPFALEDVPEIELRIAHLLHPVLLWPIADAELTLQGARGGLQAALASARWARVPIAGELYWEEQPGRRITAELTASGAGPASIEAADPASRDANEAAAAPEAVALPSDRSWFDTQVLVKDDRLVGLPCSRASARLRIVGSEARFESLDAALEPSGALQGELVFELGDPEAVPVRFDHTMEGAELAEIGAIFGMEPGLAQGALDTRGTVIGTLLPDDHMLASLSGTIDIEATNGELRQRMPLILALFQASESWNAIAARDQVHYDSMTATVGIDRGRLFTDALSLEGPMSLFVSGYLDAGRPVQTVDALVGLFLLPNAETVLGDLPLISAFLPGSSRGLVGAYFEMGGTWDEPTVKALPLKTLAEELPDVIKTPLRAIKKLFSSGNRRERREKLNPR